MVSERAITFLIGLMGVSFCLNVWLRKGPAAQAKPVQRIQGSFWGAVSGFTSFISHSGGPPFQVYILPQKLSKAQFAGTATLFFAVINAAKIIPYQFLRPYTLDALYESAFLVPTALLGTLAGAYVNRKLADKWFFLVVQLALFGISLKLLLDASGWLSS